MKAVNKYKESRHGEASKMIASFEWIHPSNPIFKEKTDKKHIKTEAVKNLLGTIHSSELWGKHYNTNVQKTTGLTELIKIKQEEKYRKLYQKSQLVQEKGFCFKKEKSQKFQKQQKKRLKSALERFKVANKHPDRNLMENDDSSLAIVKDLVNSDLRI